MQNHLVVIVLTLFKNLIHFKIPDPQTNFSDDLLKLVLKLMVVSNVKMDYKKYNFRIFPDYECRVMAFILFAFKLLFSLNDITEFQHSDFADTVNK